MCVVYATSVQYLFSSVRRLLSWVIKSGNTKTILAWIEKKGCKGMLFVNGAMNGVDFKD